ncbi:MAG: ASCH domain-containing protein [Planctomycetota bacterium]
MSIHVAILQKPYLDAVLEGRKTIESRLTKTKREPFEAITTGERLFLKQSGGPFRATALATRVEPFANLTPPDVEWLRQKYQASVGGDDAYWAEKAGSRFAVFVTLGSIEAISVGPNYATQWMRAWYVLPNSASPLHDVVLTAGAIRNRYAAIPDISDRWRASAITLVLPDGREVRTDVVAGGRLRWRGWGQIYSEAGAKPGDRLRFLALGDDRLGVSFPDQKQAPLSEDSSK